nr:DEAD/DEAH box helicase family protein [Lachnospiraceae bacterium]
PYGLRRFLIHMPTGTGKTKTATHIICHHYNYNLKKTGLIIWIAHTTELLQQAYDTFRGVWKNIGNGTIKMYKLWGEYSVDDTEEELNGFMVCGIQKLQSINNSNPKLLEKLIGNARLIVYDEAHKASAPETRQVVEKFMVRKGDSEDRALMGLSATPGKTTEDSFDNQLLVSMFGNKIIEIDTKLMNSVNMSPQEALNAPAEKDVIRYFQNRGVLSKIRKEELVYEDGLSDEEINKIRIVATANGYEDFSKSVLEKIGKNKSRNLRIMQRLRELNRDKIPTIVFACSVQHGQMLSAMLTLEDIPNALVIGNMSSRERADSIKRFKDREDDLNILINYEVLTTGFDATNIECVFIARPTQSVVLYSQMLGRGLRGPQMGGNEECLLIDVKDNLKQFNENMAFSHFANYWNQ